MKEKLFKQLQDTGVIPKDATIDKYTEDQLIELSGKEPVIAMSDVKDVMVNFAKDLAEQQRLVAEAKANPVGKDLEKKLEHEDPDYRTMKKIQLMAKGKQLSKSGGSLSPEENAKLKELEDIDRKAVDPQSVGTPADGGYLVPTLTQAKIYEMAVTNGAFKNFTQLPMAGNVIRMPKELLNPTWYWMNENASITSSKATLSYADLTPQKGGALVTLSNEVLRRANPSIASYITKKIAQVRATAFDAKFFANSNSTFTGIFYASNAFGKTTTLATNSVTTGLTNKKINETIFGIDQAKLAGAKWVMHRTVWAEICNMEDDSHRPFVPFMDQVNMTFKGFPVLLVENAPTDAANTPVMLLGNLENSIMGTIDDMLIDMSTEAYVDATSLFQYDLAAIRVLSSVAFDPGMVSEYAVIKTKAGGA